MAPDSLRAHVLAVLDFRPPKDSPALIKFAKLTWPLCLKHLLHDTTVKPIDGALDRFNRVAGQRAMVCPNHANRHDPLVIFELSRMVGEDFNYVAARETFDWNKGLNGWLLQHGGAFSIVRGAADRESFKMSRRIIAEGKKKLVLFPEGEISRQNETVLPIETGAAQICFWAIEEMAKQDQNFANKPVYIVPVALRYTFSKDVRPTLLMRLDDLERRVNLKASTAKANAYDRLRSLCESSLAAVEEEFGFKANPELGLGDRVVGLRSHILKKLADQLNVSLHPNESQLNWIRTIRNAMDDFIYADHSPLSEYQKKISEEKARLIRGTYRHLDRIVNFISVYQGYLKECNTQEHFTDLLERLESEILRRDPSLKGPRVVYLNVAQPINMTDLYSEYKAAKKKTVAMVTDQIAKEISAMVLELDKLRTPITFD
jgi:1-acyl-sn-glycerol-3-phosphate acyltransferase